MNRTHFKNSSKGQSIVETALVLPILLLILTGIIDFGFLFNNYIMILNASREGARCAAIGCSDAEIDDIVGNAAAMLDETKLTMVINPDESMRKKGDEITVTIRYQYSPITPLIGSIVSDPVELEVQTVMRME